MTDDDSKQEHTSTSNSTTPVQRIRILAPTTQIRPTEAQSTIPPAVKTAAPIPSPSALPSPSTSTIGTSTRPILGRNWTTNTTRHGTAPRAATFFLGKDYERWQRYDRDSLGLENKLGWKRGSASAVQPNAFDPDDFSGSSSEGDYDQAIDSEDDVGLSDHESIASSSRFRIDSTSMGLHHRLRSSRTSVSTHADSPPLTDAGSSVGASSRRSSMRRFSQSQTSSGSRSRRSSTSVRRERRFSSNGNDAAMHRHETVIGIHTPRCDSVCSTSPGSSGGRHTPLLGDMSSAFERIGIAPLSQIKNSPLPSRTASGIELARTSAAPPVVASPTDVEVEGGIEIDDPSKARTTTATKRERSPQSRPPRSPRLGKAPRRRASILLEEAAAAAVAEAEAVQARSDREAETLATAEADAETKLGTKRLRGKLGMRDEIVERNGGSKSHDARRGSASIALALAKRKKPIRLEGTLYDRSGPFREGAVHDGLSVRLFSTEQPDRSTGEVTTYLITTPDNRVASAAKLRRWAMDGAGNFFAAMEIKSIEAKLRHADPQAMAAAGAGAGAGTRELARELRTTYVDDLLDEVQKAETLNPGRTTVANVLRTEDGKYIRLEEDYPEEAFFVIAGCEEDELAAVCTLVFAQALRKIVNIHQAGWMHGDIKLENLMFDATGELLVIDYENANPYRGVSHAKALARWQASTMSATYGDESAPATNGHSPSPPADTNIDPDGLVRLMSYDWTPPEAIPSPHGRCMGPTGDMWALGCNLVRAFALRDGIADTAVREALLGDGQVAFLRFRDALVSVGAKDGELRVDMEELGRLIEVEDRESAGESWDRGLVNGNGEANGDDYFAVPPALSSGSSSKVGGVHADVQTPTAFDPIRDTEDIMNGHGLDGEPSTPAPPTLSNAPCSPTHLLRRFYAEAPRILSYVLAHCITAHVLQRSARTGAEARGLELVKALEIEERDRFERGLEAVKKAIELSGSEWVRPKLEEARESLGLV